MPAKPLIESPRVRGVVIAGLMIVVFALSIGGAWAVVQSRNAAPSPSGQGVRPQVTPLFKHVRLDDLSFSLPPNWTQVSADNGILAAERRRAGDAVVMVDQSQQTRGLLITKLTTPEASDPAEVLRGAMTELLGQQRLAEIRVIRQIGLHYQHEGLVGAETVGLAASDDGQRIEPHILAVLTDDRRTYWLFYLVDSIPYEQGKDMEAFAQQAVTQDSRLMLEILRSVTIARSES